MGVVTSFVASVQEPAPGLERQAIIDLSAIANNIRHLRSLVAPAQFMAVVKADAYGHGAVPVARTAVAAGANWLGAAHISEALALRAAGMRCPSWPGCTPPPATSPQPLPTTSIWAAQAGSWSTLLPLPGPCSAPHAST